jgi:type I restriction enzyme S subunit
MMNQKNVGWVRPEAVTHQTETVRVTPLGEVTVPKIDQGGPVGVGEFVYVDISSVDNKLKRITEQKTLAVKAAPSRAKQQLKAGDVLVSMTRPNLNAVAMVPPELDGAVASTGFHVLRAIESTEPRWLYYAVQTHHFISAMSELVQGALYPAVRPKDIRAFEIPVPPLDQQKRIVEEIEKQFSRLDEAVANLKRVKANLKRYKAAVLKAAVEGRLVETEAELARRAAQGSANVAGGRTPGATEDRSYETGAQLLQRILETRRSQWKGKGKYKEPTAPDKTDLAELPEGWALSSLDSLLREPLRNGHSAKATDNPNGLRAFTLSAVTEGDFSEANTKRTIADRAKVADLWAQPGDIYIERSNTPELVGTARLYRGPRNFAFIPDLLIRIRVCDYVLPEFVEIALLSDSGRSYFKGRAQGISGSMPKIDQSVIECFVVRLPPLAEQQRIVAEVDRRFSLVREVGAQIDADLMRAERLRQAILGRAFSGLLGVSERRDTYRSREGIYGQ